MNCEDFDVNWNDITNISESDYIDPITGNFLEEPVRLISDGFLQDTPINLSTAKECKKCPFTNLNGNLIKIVPFKSLSKKLEIWKKKILINIMKF